eukprot:1541807-Rhodomonas_salina.1
MHSEFKKEKEETKEKKEKTAAETEGLEKVPEEKKEATAEADEEADGKQGKEPGDLEPQDMQPEMQEALAQLQVRPSQCPRVHACCVDNDEGPGPGFKR